MSPQHTEFAKRNEQYVANFGDKGSLPMPPGKKLIIGDFCVCGGVMMVHIDVF